MDRTRHTPKVVIGLPVYNGENYLTEAITSILDQTFTDFHLVISDNASTDSTQDICQDFAARDDRIDYQRQPTNIGAAPNFCKVFQPGDSPYFKWAAHDDTIRPGYLEAVVPLLDANPDAVVAHTRSRKIDETGTDIGDYDNQVSLRHDTIPERFWSILWASYFTELFGLIRSDAAARTRLHEGFPGSDRNFVAELLMQGTVVYSSEVQMDRRAHDGSYVRKAKNRAAQKAWFDPNAKFKMPVSMVKTQRYLQAIARHDMSASDRRTCRWMVARWTALRAREELRLRLTGRKRRGNLFQTYGVTSLRTELGLGERA